MQVVLEPEVPSTVTRVLPNSWYCQIKPPSAPPCPVFPPPTVLCTLKDHGGFLHSPAACAEGFLWPSTSVQLQVPGWVESVYAWVQKVTLLPLPGADCRCWLNPPAPLCPSAEILLLSSPSLGQELPWQPWRTGVGKDPCFAMQKLLLRIVEERWVLGGNHEERPRK